MLAPATLESKLIIQELWKRKLNWNEELQPPLRHQWNEWKTTQRELPFIEIPKLYGLKFSRDSALELKVFADASNCASGTVADLRFKSSIGFKCSFVIGKSRITPIKKM